MVMASLNSGDAINRGKSPRGVIATIRLFSTTELKIY
jgi:hypothetical protein